MKVLQDGPELRYLYVKEHHLVKHVNVSWIKSRAIRFIDTLKQVYLNEICYNILFPDMFFLSDITRLVKQPIS